MFSKKEKLSIFFSFGLFLLCFRTWKNRKTIKFSEISSNYRRFSYISQINAAKRYRAHNFLTNSVSERKSVTLVIWIKTSLSWFQIFQFKKSKKELLFFKRSFKNRNLAANLRFKNSNLTLKLSFQS